jgi:protein-S-isoprenylcysteine O-methyltransferase Ste14
MKVAPRSGERTAQKIIMVFAMLGFIAMLVFPALDHRFGRSSVPASVSLVGDALIALGSLFIFFVFRENSYGASTIQIAEGQTVISTGPYALVRHPQPSSCSSVCRSRLARCGGSSHFFSYCPS